MKFVFLIESYKQIGGGPYSIFKFAEQLHKLGHEIHVFCERFPLFFEEKMRHELDIHTRISFYGRCKGSRILENWFVHLYDRLQVIPYIRNIKPDVLVSHWMVTAIRGRQIKKATGVKHCVFAFETPLWLNKVFGENHFEKNFHKWLQREWEKYRIACTDAEYVIGNSHLAEKENAQWLGKDITGFVYPGIDHCEPKKGLKKEHQVIYLGRLNKYKRVDMILEALALIKDAPKFIVCGGGEEEQNLRSLAEKLKVDCDFRGPVTEEEKWEQLHKSKCMLYPTAFEGFGMPPSEALIMGTPCICSSLPILKEVYQGSVIYFDNTKEDLAEKLTSVLSSKYSAKKNRDFILDRLSWKKSAEKIERLLS